MSAFEIFQFDFMVRAFIAGIIISLIAPTIGIFLVVRRYSLIADTLAHVSLFGVAIGVLINTQPIIGAIGVSVIAALGIEKLRETKRFFGESILALFLSGSLALAIVLFSASKGSNVNLFSYLFGSISTVSVSDLYLIIILGVFILISVILFYKELFFISFDEENAQASGLPVKLLNFSLILLTALTVSISMRIVGTSLIGALMVIPVITAVQFNKSFNLTLLIAVLISSLSVIIGLYSSYYLDLASGGTIVVVTLIFFILTLFIKRR